MRHYISLSSFSFFLKSQLCSMYTKSLHLIVLKPVLCKFLRLHSWLLGETTILQLETIKTSQNVNLFAKTKVLIFHLLAPIP